MFEFYAPDIGSGDTGKGINEILTCLFLVHDPMKEILFLHLGFSGPEHPQDRQPEENMVHAA